MRATGVWSGARVTSSDVPSPSFYINHLEDPLSLIASCCLRVFLAPYFWLCSARLEFPHTHTSARLMGCCSSTRAGSEGDTEQRNLVVNTRLVVSDDGKVQVRITNARAAALSAASSPGLPSMAASPAVATTPPSAVAPAAASMTSPQVAAPSASKSDAASLTFREGPNLNA